MRLSLPIRRLSKALAAIAMVQVFVLVAAIVYDVVQRFVFNAPTVWAYDLSSMLAGTLFYLAAGYTLRERGHVAIDFLSARFSARTDAIVQALFYGLLFLPILGWIAWAMLAKAHGALLSGEVDYTSLWAPVMWPFYGTIALGLLVLWLEAFALLIDRIAVAGGRRSA